MTDLRTDSVDTFLCAVEPGAEHDFRPYHYTFLNRPHISWRCVWCHGVACGDYDEPDPCWRVYHHVNGHRTRSGIEWPLGGSRPLEPVRGFLILCADETMHTGVSDGHGIDGRPIPWRPYLRRHDEGSPECGPHHVRWC
jgi:hypothetical protein